MLLSSIFTVEGAAPSFTVPVSTTSPGSVDENSSKDISILTVEGQDTDGNPLMFSLVSQTPTSPPFLLDGTSGLLKTPAGLDAEFSLTYNFTFGYIYMYKFLLKSLKERFEPLIAIKMTFATCKHLLKNKNEANSFT